MSGLEVVGAIASVAQLGESAARLIICLRNLEKNIDLSAKRFREHQQQIKELRQIVEYITETNSLQSYALLSPIKALLETAEALQEALVKDFVDDPSNPSKKWRNRVKGLQVSKAEDTISKGFDELERHKSTLTLCVLGNLGGLIERIDSRLESGIPDLQYQVEKIERSLRTYSGITNESRRIRDGLTGTTMLRAGRDHGVGQESKELAIIGACAIDDGDDDSTLVALSPHSTDLQALDAEQLSIAQPNEGTTQNQDSNASAETRIYKNNAAFEESSQLNGTIGSPMPGERRIAYSHWNNNKSGDQSRQINGDILDANFASLFFVRG